MEGFVAIYHSANAGYPGHSREFVDALNSITLTLSMDSPLLVVRFNRPNLYASFGVSKLLLFPTAFSPTTMNDRWKAQQNQDAPTSTSIGTTCAKPIHIQAEIHSATKLQLARAVYDWVTCLFVAGMVISQFFGVIASSVDRFETSKYGRDPELGPYSSGMTNDVPYTDRALVCAFNHGVYEPVQLSELISSPKTSVMASNASDADLAGFRVIERTGLVLDTTTLNIYASFCGVASSTMDAIYNSCHALGHNVSEDVLRVVPGVESNAVVMIPDVLPILILPYWDNAPVGRFVVPAWDGSSCVLRLAGSYMDPTSSEPLICGTKRSIREAKTAEWLGRRGGVWRHGWYEDLMGDKWYSFIMTSATGSHGLPRVRYFNGLASSKTDCNREGQCNEEVRASRWGPSQFTETVLGATSVVVYNAQQYGLFLFESFSRMRLSSRYEWKMAVSNVSIGVLVFRWLLSLHALRRGYTMRQCALHSIGIGALANSPSFLYLPIFLLPRLNTILSAFFTIGCAFQGDQAAFSETWFIIYPAIVELMLVYYSLINTLAQVLRRRVSDVLFAPTILMLMLLHVFRAAIPTTHWFDVPNFYIQTLVPSEEISRLKLHQFFSTDIALRLNGGVVKLFVVKLTIFGASLIPLLLARQLPAKKDLRSRLSGSEKALAIRASNLGGLGRSQIYQIPSLDSVVRLGASNRSQKGPVVRPMPACVVLSSYEIVRLGYIMYGGKYLISMDDWDRVSMLAGVRNLYHLWNHRVVVFKLHKSQVPGPIMKIGEYVSLRRVDDPKLLNISIWDISACYSNC